MKTGTLEVFAVSGGELFHKRQDGPGGGWGSGWENLGLPTPGQPYWSATRLSNAGPALAPEEGNPLGVAATAWPAANPPDYHYWTGNNSRGEAWYRGQASAGSEVWNPWVRIGTGIDGDVRPAVGRSAGQVQAFAVQRVRMPMPPPPQGGGAGGPGFDACNSLTGEQNGEADTCVIVHSVVRSLQNADGSWTTPAVLGNLMQPWPASPPFDPDDCDPVNGQDRRRCPFLAAPPILNPVSTATGSVAILARGPVWINNGGGYSQGPEGVTEDVSVEAALEMAGASGAPAWYGELSGGSWDWTEVGGSRPVVGGAVAVLDGENLLEAFAVAVKVEADGDSTNVVQHSRRAADGTWSAWTELVDSGGVQFMGTPAVGRNIDGTLEVFAGGEKGGSEGVFRTHQSWTDGTWSVWEPMGGGKQTSPVVVMCRAILACV